MPRIRIPIWLLMAAVLVFAVYIAAFRMLMEKRIGGHQQAAMGIGVTLGLVSLTTTLLALAGVFLKRTQQAAEPELAPIRVPQPIHCEPLGLEIGERLRLPDGSVCRVREYPSHRLQAVLDYEPPRRRQERGGIASELIEVRADRSVWRYSEVRSGAHVIYEETPTGWTLDDLKRIE